MDNYLNDTKPSALERRGLGASFERDTRFIGGLEATVSFLKLNEYMKIFDQIRHF